MSRQARPAIRALELSADDDQPPLRRRSASSDTPDRPVHHAVTLFGEFARRSTDHLTPPPDRVRPRPYRAGNALGQPEGIHPRVNWTIQKHLAHFGHLSHRAGRCPHYGGHGTGCNWHVVERRQVGRPCPGQLENGELLALHQRIPSRHGLRRQERENRACLH